MEQKDIALEKTIDELKSDIKKLKESRVSQTGVIPGAIKMRAMGEGNRFMRSGLAADIPTVGETATDSSAYYYATDTNVLYLWDGTVWKSITVADYTPPSPTRADSDYPNYPKLVNRQDYTSNTTVSNQLIQTGWYWKLGDGANRVMTQAITFPVAYDSAPIVMVSYAGSKSTTDPANITELLSSTQGVQQATCGTVTTSGFNISLSRVSVDGADPGVFVNTSRYGASWIAIGTKAR